MEAVAKDHSNVDVSWSTDAAVTQDEYQLRYHDDTKPSTWSKVVSLTDKKKTVTGLFPGDQYTFEVKAVSHSQTSAVKTKTAVLCKSFVCLSLFINVSLTHIKTLILTALPGLFGTRTGGYLVKPFSHVL